jgi:acetyl esterase/lipase
MRTLLPIAFLLCSSSSLAQQEFELWPDGPPYSRPVQDTESIDDCWGGVRCAHRVTTPTLTLYPSGESQQTWLLVMPGGGYDVVAIYHEGSEIAEAFAERGISTAVLKYRVPDIGTATEPSKVPFADFPGAMEMLRAEQEDLLSWVTKDTPPAFFVHAVDDDVSPYTESTLYADALRDNGVDAELHLFARGGHGFGPGRDGNGTNQWISLAANWVKRLYGQRP